MLFEINIFSNREMCNTRVVDDNSSSKKTNGLN